MFPHPFNKRDLDVLTPEGLAFLAAQGALLDRPGLDLPQRLRVPPPVARTAEV